MQHGFTGAHGVVGSQEEGIIVKRADTQWKYATRDNSWVKLKPEYVVKQVRFLESIIL